MAGIHTNSTIPIGVHRASDISKIIQITNVKVQQCKGLQTTGYPTAVVEMVHVKKLAIPVRFQI